MEFCTDNHGPQRINPTDVGGPLTFHLAPPAGKSCHLSGWIDRNCYTDILAP